MRPLSPSEALSESDDDIPTPWMTLAHANALAASSAISPTRAAFLQRWDAWFETCGARHKVYTGDMLIRFVQEERGWMKGTKGMRREFGREARKLVEEGVVGEGVIVRCWDLIAGAKVEGDEGFVESRLAKEKREQDGLRQAWERAWREGCVCGKAVVEEELREAVSCASAICAKPDFHMACVGLERREPGWLCPKCRPGIYITEGGAATA